MQGTGGKVNRRWIAAGAMLVVVAAVAFVVVWFQPQKLFLDDRVNEAFPTVATTAGSPPSTLAPTTLAPGTDPATTTSPAAPGSSSAPVTTPPATIAPATTVPPGPVLLRQGSFTSLDHDTSGMAIVYRLEDGSNVLRISDFATSNGPDLFVYLTANSADGPEGAFDDTFVNLGRLKGNVGDQNYEIPAGIDLETHPNVVIWCDRFNSAFGAADLV